MANQVKIKVEQQLPQLQKANVQVWDDNTSQHLLGQTSLQRGQELVINSDSDAQLVENPPGSGNFTLTLK